MKRVSTHLTRIPFLLLALASILWAQAEPQVPKPGPEYQRLHDFVGDWYTEGKTLPGPMGAEAGEGVPGEKFTSTDHNEMLGDFFVIFHSDERDATGPGKEIRIKKIGIMGYDPERKLYTFEQFSDQGERATLTATVSGDTWVFLWPATDAAKEGGKRLKGRLTVKKVSPTSSTFTNEVSIDGGPWTKIQEGKATKK